VLVQEHGEASQQKALAPQERATRPREMRFSMGGTLIILLIAFGAAVAAGVPLFLGITSFVATHRPARPRQQADALHEAVGQVTMLIGLASASTTRCSTCAG